MPRRSPQVFYDVENPSITRTSPPRDVENLNVSRSPRAIKVSKHYESSSRGRVVPKKRGHTLFGCFCDTRRATLFFNSLNIIYSTVILVFIIAGVDFWIRYKEEHYFMNDDEQNDKSVLLLLLDEGSSTNEHVFYSAILGNELVKWSSDIGLSMEQLAIAYTSTTLFFAILGIFGAVEFQAFCIFLTVVWYLFSTIINAILLDPIGMGINLLLLYPHVLLCVELCYGIMTRKNYERREQSCCLGKRPGLP